MLPPSWKQETQDTVEEAASREREERKIEQANQAAGIATRLAAIYDQLKAHNERRERAEKRKKWFDVATAFFVFATALFTGLAWFVFNGQLHEMEKAYGPLEKSAIAAKESADATKNAVQLAERTAERQLRAYFDISLGAIFLNSPSPGQMTAWTRFKNAGATPAYKVRGWHQFTRGLTGQAPFDKIGEFENEAIVGPGGNFNLNSTLTVSPEQLQAVRDRTLSLYVWGRIEYLDAFEKQRHFSFKAIMNGNTETILVDGTNAQGWGLRPVKDGFDAN
jgi:hypothetical protein